jgi:hypothetical protein
MLKFEASRLRFGKGFDRGLSAINRCGFEIQAELCASANRGHKSS